MAEEFVKTWNWRDPNEWLARYPRRQLPPMIVSVALTGGAHGKEINPNHPETPEEQAADAYECYKLGASAVHIHARRADNPSVVHPDRKRYREINGLIREKCPDIIINNTTTGVPLPMIPETFELSLECLYAKPELCSFDVGPLTGIMRLNKRPPYRMEDIAEPSEFNMTIAWGERLCKVAMENGVKPELEIWHEGQIPIVKRLFGMGLLKPPLWVQYCLGALSGAQPTPETMMHLATIAPENSVIGYIGLMPYHIQVLAQAALLGHNARTGMEDNPYLEKGVLAKSNAELVEKMINLVKILGRDIATPKQARQILGISEKPTKY